MYGFNAEGFSCENLPFKETLKNRIRYLIGSTAAYQRGIHSVGKALKFRTKAFSGIRKGIIQIANSMLELIGNISLGVIFHFL